ncbi:MAG: flavodoxin domain-containing protein [Defluviitaleaceae bacterium]|nr:flavodoxin domain-containing protein [Defluviitaleaceae bacterium]
MNPKNIAVIYTSRYGTTKRYAEWISAELNAPLFAGSEIKPGELNKYDTIVYGGGLYAGEIAGIKSIVKNFPRSLVLFTMSLADPNITDFTPVIKKALNPEQLEKTKIFHFRGGVDYAKLSLVHKGLMAMVKRAAEKIPPDERTSDDTGILETYGKEVDFTCKSAIAPLIEYVRAL